MVADDAHPRLCHVILIPPHEFDDQLHPPESASLPCHAVQPLETWHRRMEDEG